MEEKNIALCILGVIAIIAIVGLIMLFTAEQAAARTFTEYPGGVFEPTPKPVPSYYSAQYYTSSGEPVVEPAKLPYPIPVYKTVQ